MKLLSRFPQAGGSLLLLAFCLSGCFEPKEGCLDIAGTNFDVAADKDCCCEYPQLVLSINQIYDTLPFRNDALYPDAQGNLFRIISVAFYLSDFQFFQNGNRFQISDTLTLNTLVGTDTSAQVFIQDFELVRRAPVQYAVGTFRQDGIFERLTFRVGLTDSAQQIIPFKVPNGHPLAPQSDRLWVGNAAGFVFLQAVVVRDSALTSADADTLRFTQADLGQSILEANGPFLHPTGFDFPLTLEVDYRVMFEGVIWSQYDISAWKSQISLNLPNAFRVIQ